MLVNFIDRLLKPIKINQENKKKIETFLFIRIELRLYFSSFHSFQMSNQNRAAERFIILEYAQN